MALSWGNGGRVVWLRLVLRYFFVVRSDKNVTYSAGVVLPVLHCLTWGEVTIYDLHGGMAVTRLQGHQATYIEVRFRGHKGDQAPQGSVMTRTREEARGPRSGIGAGGGAVAFMVELLLSHPTLPENAPLSSYRCGIVCEWSIMGLHAGPSGSSQSGRKGRR